MITDLNSQAEMTYDSIKKLKEKKSTNNKIYCIDTLRITKNNLSLTCKIATNFTQS